MRLIWTIYIVAGGLTLAFYLFQIWGQCGELLDCKTMPLKAVAFTVLWPFYWIFFINGLG